MKPKLTVYDVETTREADGRWIADITNVPGAMAYGETETAAIDKALVIARAALAEKSDA